MRTRHEQRTTLPPERALAVALAAPAAPDRAVRLLFRVRGLPRAATVEDLFARIGFDVLERTETSYVIGASGRPWWPERLSPFASASPGTVRIVADLRAEGPLLSTETRVAATDDRARRAFRLYWRVIGPFSSLVRRRWLASVA